MPTLILTLLVSLSLGPAHARDIPAGWCSQVENYFDDIKRNEEYSIKEVLDENPQVVIFGELHHDFQSHEVYMDIQQKMAALDHNFDCLFIESSQDYNTDALNDWLDDRISFDTMVSELCDDLRTPEHKKKCDGYVARVFPKIFKKRMELGKKLGLQIYFMDGPWDPYFSFEPSDYDHPSLILSLGYGERNLIMARNIAKRFKSKQCHKAFAITGYGHTVYETKKAFGIKNIRNHLKTHGIHAVTIDVFSTDKTNSLGKKLEEEDLSPYTPMYMPKKECNLELPRGKLYNFPDKSPVSVPSPETLKDNAWIYSVAPELKHYPLGVFDFIWMR